MDVLRPFDPWKDPWCTCPPKLSLNPYTGCSHACVYCYISSYIPNPFRSRAKEDFLRRLRRDARVADLSIPVSISNSSDPYPPEEGKKELMRGCLEILRSRGAKVMIITKSDLVLRDLDMLRQMKCVVSFTITTLDPSVRRRIEPKAPPSQRRLDAIEQLSECGIPCTVRVDPIIPGVNEKEIEDIISACADAGARHVTASTLKLRFDALRRMKSSIPEMDFELYRNGERRRNCIYLPRKIREELLQVAMRKSMELGLSFGVCREGMKLNTASCDGSHLLHERA